MRPAKVTDEQIIDAGKALERKKDPVNGWSLRREIGAGKPERLEKVWKSFIGEGDGFKIEQKENLDHILPKNIEDSLNCFIDKLSVEIREIVVSSDSQSVYEAESKAKLTYSSLEDEVQSYKEQLSIAATTLDELDQKLGDLGITDEKNAELQQSILHLDKENTKLIAEKKGLENLLAERLSLVEETTKFLSKLQKDSDEQKIVINKLKSLMTSKQIEEFSKPD